MGAIVNALVDAIEQGGSTVALSTPVANINLDALGRRAIGVTTAKVGNRKSTELRTKSGVVCNAPAWSLAGLLGQVSDEGKSGEDETEGQVETNSSSRHMGKPSLPPAVATYVDKTQVLGMTQSYMHLHLTLDATGLDLDALEAHYTVNACLFELAKKKFNEYQIASVLLSIRLFFLLISDAFSLPSHSSNICTGDGPRPARRRRVRRSQHDCRLQPLPAGSHLGTSGQDRGACLCLWQRAL